MALVFRDEKGENLTPAEVDENFRTVAAAAADAATAADNAVAKVWTAADQTAMLALSSAKKGQLAKRTDVKAYYILTSTSPSTLGDWLLLGYYDNIPASTLGGKTLATVESERDTAISNAVAAILNSAPAALDTLDELAAALGDDANFASTVTTALGNKVNTSDIVNDLVSSDVNKPLSAAMGKSLKDAADLKVVKGADMDTTVATDADAMITPADIYFADLSLISNVNSATGKGWLQIKAAGAVVFQQLTTAAGAVYVRSKDGSWSSWSNNLVNAG